MKNNLLRLLSPCFLLLTNCAYAQVSGTVFRDFNANGVKDNTATFNEPFASAVIVKAFNSLGMEVGSTTSDGNGSYAFTGLVLPLRIEFTNLTTGDFSAASGASNSSSVQFYSSATTTANFGVNYPDDYCNNNPFFASNVYVASPGTNGTNGLAAIPYGTTGAGAPLKQELNTPYNVIGSVWGMAHQRESNTLFSAAFMKRHSAFGSGGTGAIYKTTGTNNPTTSATLPYIDLQTLAAITTGANPHATDITIDEDNVNGSPFDAVGKISFGDMDISADGKYIFVVNLFEKKIHRIFIDNPAKPAASLTAADVTSWDIPNPCDATQGTSRPWGLAVNRGKVYVGVVCDASVSLSKDNLSATVYEMDPTNGSFTAVLNFPLDYLHGAASSTSVAREYWNAWRPIYYKAPSSTSYGAVNPQPILSDIDFDTDGTMILGFTDRSSHQFRMNGSIQDGSGSNDPRLAGDILRAGKCSTTNIWTIENNASVCGGTATAGMGNTQGPSGGEFYFEDQYNNNHLETSQGAVAMLRGSNQVIMGGMDPLNIYSAGFYYMNNTTGMVDGKYELVSNGSGAFGKAGAIGDVEMLCFSQPIEIGNRVFLDTDEDGIQGANEPGIANVSLEIFADFDNDGTPDGVALSSVTTNSEGVWYFNVSNIIDGDPTTAGNQVGLTFNKNYIIRVAASDWTSGSGAAELFAREITKADEGGAGQADAIDSDAKIVNTIPQIKVLIGNSGENNHTLDFGFRVACLLTANPPTGTGTKCKGGSDGTSSVTISGNFSPVSYLWSNTSATAAITGLTAGTYTVTVTETASCTATASYTVTEPSVLVLDCTKTDVTTVSGTDGTASVTATGGTATYTYLWSDAAASTTATISGLAAGTYMVTVTDANLCTKVCSSIVNAPGCNLTATATGTSVKCNGGSDGTATALAAGNISTVTYLWSNAASSTTATITGLAAGTYMVTVTETASCTATASYTVTEPSVLILDCTKTDVTTVGGTDGIASVTATGGTATYSYLWSDAAASTTATISGLAAGTYMVTVTDANLCTKVCSSIVTQPTAAVCNLIDGGVTVTIDEKGTSSTADDEYVIYANPTGTGFAATYNVSGDINKTGVAYGSIQEIGRTSTANSTISYFIEDAADANCSIADAAFNLDGNTCILKVNPTVLCNNNGTPTDPSDDTYSVTLNPTGNGIGATYNVTGGITANGVAYGSAQQIATGLLISAGGVTITVKDAATPNCELINIRIDPPAACSGNGVAKLDLVKTVDLAEAKVGDNVTYTIVVSNTGTAISNAIEVTDTLNSGLQFVSASPAVAYNSTTGVWTVGTLAVGASATLTITAKLLAIGVTQNYADITLGGNNDSDGPLNNHDVVCTTVPIELCTGTTFTLSIPNNYTDIQWFKDGVAISGAVTSNLLVSTIGDYTFTSKETLNGCPATGCCPVKVEAGTNCCPAKICLPVKLTRN